jgi:hypothetical protein
MLITNKALWRLKIEEAQADAVVHGAPTTDSYRSMEKEVAINIWRWAEGFFQNVLPEDHSTVLDIGGKYGAAARFATKLHQNVRAICVDSDSGSFPKVSDAYHNLSFICADIEEHDLLTAILPVKANMIFCNELIPYLGFRLSYTLKMLRDTLLAENGVVYLSFPDTADYGRDFSYYASLADIPRSPLHGASKAAGYNVIWLYSEEEVRNEISEAGLVIKKSAYAMGPQGKHINLALSR